MAKVGRNTPCPCGSGKKYKHCHGGIISLPQHSISRAAIEQLLRRTEAQERIRETQQGRGKPIISGKLGGHQFVAVGSKIHYSNQWMTFNDFLLDYIKKILTPEWGNHEIKRPFEQRHPIMQWYDAFCKLHEKPPDAQKEVMSWTVTGLVACYLGLAYSLYLIAHNVELQGRLVRRLKDRGNFQGAYYELIIANVLIRSGFTLELEDETDPQCKHCEFQAISKRTGKKYSVEAKMRSVRGLLGRTEVDGGKDGQYLARLGQHVNKSLAKPSFGERLIFVDVNGPQTYDKEGKPVWVEPAMERLERLEREDLPIETKAYVFVTNVAYHRQLDKNASCAVAPFGLGMPDFARPGFVKLVDAYEAKQRHIDAFEIAQAFLSYSEIPSTFDGRLTSEAFGGTSGRIIIGETYDFDGLIGTVTTACVANKEMHLAIRCIDGKGRLLRMPMTDVQFRDYEAHPEEYFGEIISVTKHAGTPLELFEGLMDIYSKTTKEKLVEWMSPSIDKKLLDAMPQDSLAKLYCEQIAAAMQPDKVKVVSEQLR